MQHLEPERLPDPGWQLEGGLAFFHDDDDTERLRKSTSEMLEAGLIKIHNDWFWGKFNHELRRSVAGRTP